MLEQVLIHPPILNLNDVLILYSGPCKIIINGWLVIMEFYFLTVLKVKHIK